MERRMEQEIKQNFYVVIEKENCIMVTWGGGRLVNVAKNESYVAIVCFSGLQVGLPRGAFHTLWKIIPVYDAVPS